MHFIRDKIFDILNNKKYYCKSNPMAILTILENSQGKVLTDRVVPAGNLFLR